MSCIVPILPIELYQFESYERIIGVMAYVENLFNATMDSVSGRILECNTKVEGLSQRITTASNRIGQAKGSSKALTIQSSPSFPKLETQDDQLLPFQKPMPRIHPQVHETEHPGQPPKGCTADVALLNSHYMSLKIPTPSILDLPQQHKEIGLGAVPDDISSASSFLLFNSLANPYNMDFQETAIEKKQIHNDRTVSVNLPDAPKSMQESDDFSNFGKKDFVYQPDTKETPKVELPEQLNILGIAKLDWDDDEDEDFTSNFSSNFSSSIKPAAIKNTGAASSSEPQQEKMPALPSLPSLETKAPPPPEKKAPPPPPPPPQNKAPPPPPPPPQNKAPPPPPPPPSQGKAPPPPPPAVIKDMPAHANAGARNEMLAQIQARKDNPLAGLKKAETKDSSSSGSKVGAAPSNASGKADPFSLLKQQIGLRFNAIHAPAVTDKSNSKPNTLSEAKRGKASDSDSYSD